MSGARYVVLGLAPPRAAWFAEVGRWAGSGTIPVDFVRCVSVDEVRARLVSGRSASALLVDYVMTVAVSVASGVDNIISAIPALNPFRVEIAVGS